jgi:hypothetical protein
VALVERAPPQSGWAVVRAISALVECGALAGDARAWLAQLLALVESGNEGALALVPALARTAAALERSSSARLERRSGTHVRGERERRDSLKR